MLDRAVQFAPFAALTGYEAAVGESARLTAERRDLDAQEAEELNRRLTELAARLPERPEVTVEYFVPDDRKAGGAYVTVTDRVRQHFPGRSWSPGSGDPRQFSVPARLRLD